MRASPRVEVSGQPGGVSLVIRNASSSLVSWFASAWLGLWLTAELKIIGVLADGSAGFLAPVVQLFLAAWTIAGAGGALALAWNQRGRVEIGLDAQRLSIRRAVGPLGLTRVHDARRLGAFRLRPAVADSDTPSRWSRLEFDDGGTPRSVGVRLEGDDGAVVLEALRGQLPLRTWPAARAVGAPPARR